MNNILTKVYESLTKVGVPVAYFNFDNTESVEAPFIIFRNTKNIVSADSDIYCYEHDFNIEFYHHGSDEELVEKFREALYEIKKVVLYEQTPLDGVILLRATFSLLEDDITQRIQTIEENVVNE
nr:MAG TPA: tail component [Caudoviricetes sp.]